MASTSLTLTQRTYSSSSLVPAPGAGFDASSRIWSMLSKWSPAIATISP